MRAHRNFEGVLQQFLQTCQLGDPADSLGGVRVLMDVLWKLFTRRRRFMDAETYLQSLNPEEASTMHADNYYHVPFLGSIVRVLTSLCIGRDNRAVKVVQDFIAKELMVTNEAAASRRRPEPECHDNYWTSHAATRLLLVLVAACGQDLLQLLFTISWGCVQTRNPFGRHVYKRTGTSQFIDKSNSN